MKGCNVSVIAIRRTWHYSSFWEKKKKFAPRAPQVVTVPLGQPSIFGRRQANKALVGFGHWCHHHHHRSCYEGRKRRKIKRVFRVVSIHVSIGAHTSNPAVIHHRQVPSNYYNSRHPCCRFGYFPSVLSKRAGMYLPCEC